MLDKDKLWLAFYVNIKGIHEKDRAPLINEFIQTFQYDESVQKIIIPTIDNESHVETIYYPNYNKDTEENLKKAQEALKKWEELINKK